MYPFHAQDRIIVNESGGEARDMSTQSRAPTPDHSDTGGLKIVARSCPLCDAPSTDAALLPYGNRDWPMRQCACGFVYLEVAPDYTELATNLSWEKTSKSEDARRMAERPVSQTLSKRTRWRMRLLKRRDMTALIAAASPAGDVLDVGCASGGHMMKLPAAIHPYGIEISEALGGIAAASFGERGGTAYIGPALQVMQGLPDGKFGAISMRSYLEHEAQPLKVLQQAFRILKPGGVVFVKVPNFGSVNRALRGGAWCGFRLPDHLNYFTPQTLALMAGRAGFSFGQPFSWHLPTSDNMWAALTRPSDIAV